MEPDMEPKTQTRKFYRVIYTPESDAEPETPSPLLPAFQKLYFEIEVDGWYGDSEANFERVALGGIFTQKELKKHIFECETASPEYLSLPGLRGNCMTITNESGGSIEFKNEKGYFTCGELVDHIVNYEEVFRPHAGPSQFQAAFDATTFDSLIPQEGENTFISCWVSED